MKKVLLILICFTMLLTLTACNGYPRLFYEENPIGQSNDRLFIVEPGYELDQSHSYDKVETEDGYDMIFHFIKARR